ncbi:MAG: hypothetical protein RQ864_12115 [Lutibacter sp.]|nr:hypothetical protein [Lutibacter sp.]
MNKLTITVVTVLFITTNIFSQSTKKFIDTGSVENQFEYIVDESNNYQDYKVVKATWLLKLKSNVIDSIMASKKKLLDNSNIMNSQKKLIDSLNIKLTETETVIADLKAEKESISLFGIQFEKTTFKTLFFLIVVGLIGALLFFITKFKRSNIITTQSKLALTQNEEEFAIYKEKALEREQKAMRRLQDELNKNKKES